MTEITKNGLQFKSWMNYARHLEYIIQQFSQDMIPLVGSIVVESLLKQAIQVGRQRSVYRKEIGKIVQIQV